MADPYRKTLPVVPAPEPVFCGECRYRRRADYDDYCQLSYVWGTPNPVSGIRYLTGREKCEKRNAGLACPDFEQRSPFWRRWLGLA